VYFGAAGLLVVILAVGVGAMTLRGQRPAPQPSSAVRRPVATGAGPASYSDAHSSQVFDGIAVRTRDARPLTGREVFPKSAKVLLAKDAGARLTLAGAQLDADCGAAVWGIRLGDVLRAAGCTQVARAAYVDKKGGYGATVAIMNLATAEHADRVVDALRDTARAGFVIPLSKVPGYDQGFSVARGRAMGHYAVIAWVWRLDGTGDAQDEALLSILVAIEGPEAVLARAAAAQGGAEQGGASQGANQVQGGGN
jgi:hypothetical protein